MVIAATLFGGRLLWRWLYLLSGVSLVTVFVVGISLVSAIGSTLRSNEDTQAQLVSEAADQVQELRTHIADRRRKVAAYLHGPIQAELLVASASGVSVEQVMASLQERFAHFGDEIPAQPLGNGSMQCRWHGRRR